MMMSARCTASPGRERSFYTQNMLEEEKIHSCKDSEAWKCCDHWHTDNIKCPNCGSENTDSWEMGEEGDEECCDCGCKFSYQRHTEITYSTETL